jgi:Cys-tRNA(Pro)/Cys-tRNA(Cys) deacylase
MKKQFPTTIHSSAQNLESIIFSGGKVWYQVELHTNDLQKIINFNFADIIK